ncbi:O-methylsterigmatocystin oxidoreductase [Leucoagaricus sp. SymC.cos]|nr:O-methylsterigmatocystin oxidoreductase [Leucoagaricus sp. SymC.cos]
MAIVISRNLVLVGILTLAYLVNRYRQQRHLRLPPGLPGKWPFVGNAFALPREYAHVFYKELGKKLGTKIIYLEAFGRPIIVINDMKVAQDLLDKRSSIYSSRPELPMLREVVGYKSFFVMEPYGEGWRLHRRMFQQYFSEANLPRFRERELEFVRKGLLQNLYQYPEDYAEYCRTCIGGLSTSLTYGLRIQRRNDPLIQFSEQGLRDGAYMTAPGKYLVNIFPELKHVPEWMPGAGFKRVAKEVRARLDENMEYPWKLSLDAINSGVIQDCFVTETLERIRDKPDFELQEFRAKEVAVQVFGALSETTISSMLTFILGMLLNPDSQRKAQEDIDSVVGNDRLVELSDLSRLRYLPAVVKETLRWNTPLPMGVPHYTTDEDEYNGYHIPKDCTILPNAHAVFHDDDVFLEPDKFDPDRFLKPDGTLRGDLLDPEAVAAFGWGRRVCPGKDIAVAMLYLSTASILQLFDISPAIDENGKPVHVKPEFLAASIGSAVFHDDDIFPEPDKFDPDRFLKPDGTLRGDLLDPEAVAAFGWGRRVCPGKDIAVAMLYLSTASILQLFDISPAIDENGKPVHVKPEFLAASIGSDPLPFRCSITPRKGKNIDVLLHDYFGDDPI